MVCDVNKLKCVEFCEWLIVVDDIFDNVIFLDECFI